MTRQEQEAKFINGKPLFDTDLKMINAMGSLPDESSAVFLKQAKLQDGDTSSSVFSMYQKMDPSASVFFPKGVNI